jgi:hypothetical protein
VRTQIPGSQILDNDIGNADIKDGAVTDVKLSATGVVPGDYTKVSVNSAGRVSAGANPTTLAGYGITDGLSTTQAALTPIITTSAIPGFTAARPLIGTAGQISFTDDGTNFVAKLSDNPIFSGTGAITITSGTTAQRPAGAAGELRYNTDEQALELFNTAWSEVVMDNDLRFTESNTLVVSMTPGKGQFSSVKTAINSITTASASNRYVVKVMGGQYYEAPMQMQRYVSVIGDAAVSTLIMGTDPNSNLFTGANDSRIGGVSLGGATSAGAAAVFFQDAPENVSTRAMILNDVKFLNNNIHVHVVSTGQSTSVFVTNSTFGGTDSYNQAAVATSTNGGQARILIRSSATVGATAPLPAEFAFVSGAGAELFFNGIQTRTSVSTPAGVGVRLNNGGLARLLSCTFRGYATAIYAENVGVAPVLSAYNVGLETNTIDINIDHPGTTGTFLGMATASKVFSTSSNISMTYLDPTPGASQGTNIVGRFNLGSTQTLLTDVTDLIVETPPMGLLSGGIVTNGTGLTLNVSAGFGYVRKSGAVTRLSWGDLSITFAPGAALYLYIDSNGTLLSNVVSPDTSANVLLVRALAGATSIISFTNLSTSIKSFGNDVDSFLRTAIGPIFISGCIVSENASTPRSIDISQGHWHFSTSHRTPREVIGATFLDLHRTSGGAPTMVPGTVIDNSTIDSPTGLISMTAGYYTKHSLYTDGDGAELTFMLGHGSAQYATLQLAHDAPIPAPLISPDSTPVIAAIITQQGTNNIVSILDLRPRFGAGAGAGSAGVSKHGDLTGLGNDDHPQYLLTNGTRTMTGNLNVGTFSITAGLVNGIDVTAHGSRHQPNGSDPLPTGPGVGVGLGSVNGTGVSNSLSRADHTHALFGVQPQATDLTALAALSTTGLGARTGAGTWSTRSITGVAGNTIVTNGDGVLGNPVIDLSTAGAPGTYATVITDAYGRVTGGTLDSAWVTIWSKITGTPTTIAGYGITNAQTLNTDLTAIAALATTGIAVRTGAGTWANRTLVAPSQGITITNPAGLAGNITVALSNDIGAIEALASTGIAVRTGTDTWAQRTIVAPATGITIANGSGAAGNPTLALANALSSLQSIASFGLGARTAADTWVTRSVLGTAQITITNGDGVLGNPTIDLGAAGTPGTYVSVSTDAYGRVTSGGSTQAWGTLTSTPSTLGGYGITDGQPLDSDLTALAGTISTGLYTITGIGTSGTRTLTAGSTKLSITNGSGVLGNPTLDIVEANLTLNNISGVLGTAKGGTNLNNIGGANSILGVNAGATGLEYKSVLAGTGISVTQGIGTTTIANTGVISFSAVAPAQGLTITTGGTASSPALTLALTNDIGAIEALTTMGIPVRTAADTWVTRAIAGTAGHITVSNGDGIAGAPTIDLGTVGAPGTYTVLSTDAYGRVISGSNPNTLAGYGITDAVNMSTLGALNGVATLDATGFVSSAQINPAVGALPNQTGHDRDVLVSDGTGAGWGTSALSHGFPNRTDSTMTYTPATRTLLLTQPGGVVFYFHGRKITAAASISLQHSATEAGYFFLFDDTTGVLKVQSTPWDLEVQGPVCYVYWDGAKGIAWEERHGHMRNLPLHKYLHTTQGTKLVNGMLISGYTLEDGSADSKTQWAMTSGTLADEDIAIAAAAVPAGTSYVLFYRDSAAPSWTFALSTAPAVAYKFGTTIQYDNAGVLTNLVAGQYVNYWVYGATTLVSPNVFSIVGQVAHATLDSALAETLVGLDLTSLPIQECVPMYKITFKCDTSYVTSGQACIFFVETIDRSYQKVKQPVQYLDMLGTTEPAAPALNHLSMYAQNRAGRLIPHWIENNGLESAIQPALFGNNVVMWLPGFGSTTSVAFGASYNALNLGTSSGQTHPSLSSTNAVTQMKRASFSTGSTSSGSSGISTSAGVAWRGNAANLGGFFLFVRFAPEAYSSSERLLIGLSANASALVANPSASANTICIGKDAADTTLQLISVSNTGVSTKVDTGITPSPSQILDFTIFCKPNDSKITARVVDGLTGAIIINNLVITTNLPANTTFMYMQSLIQSTTGTTAKLLSLNRMYLETST